MISYLVIFPLTIYKYLKSHKYFAETQTFFHKYGQHGATLYNQIHSMLCPTKISGENFCKNVITFVNADLMGTAVTVCPLTITESPTIITPVISDAFKDIFFSGITWCWKLTSWMHCSYLNYVRSTLWKNKTKILHRNCTKSILAPLIREPWVARPSTM